MKHLLKLTLLLLALLLPATAIAYDFEVDGIYYSIKGNNATVISGNHKYSGDVTIPEAVTYGGKTYSVTEIGEGAFYGCTGLTGVAIGNSVTFIGYEAFYGCSNLISITIPKSVTYIGGSSFGHCTSLDTLNFNAVSCEDFDIMFEEDFPFNYNSNFTTINIGDEVKRIPAFLALGQRKLTSVLIPNSVTEIGNGAFQECSGLTSVIIGNSVDSIGFNAFCCCSGLTSIIIPHSVTYISDGTFWDCI